MFPGSFVGEFSKLTNQFLKDVPHLLIADDLRMKVDVGELLGDHVQQIGFAQTVNLGVKVEALEDIADGGRERLDVRVHVLGDVVLIAHQLFDV
ncbi:hypothetical protein RMSM_01539 [Rhodopirellula maiorica SM1]|uniref:Uncharacterized protein n=1 Tax=Rhodopirellula maiorica SM1 TaxID=1265738 RepID=M5S5R3_9BACT|nr:hypothetical protein RMSM_01539 [Rhodopirellula maiorica SM1]